MKIGGGAHVIMEIWKILRFRCSDVVCCVLIFCNQFLLCNVERIMAINVKNIINNASDAYEVDYIVCAIVGETRHLLYL